MDHTEKQKALHNQTYAAGGRAHFESDDPLVKYVTHWRLHESFRRLVNASNGRIRFDSRILVMCAGEGAEGSVLCDMGYTNVTVSDISDVGVKQALARDERLMGIVLDAENADLANNSYDVVLVQDGLHHLQSPVGGFVQMLRISAVGVVFLEPHDSLIGRILGTRWEKNGDAINYVFRWTRKLVQDTSSSYLGPNSFNNLSFSFWHHNIVYYRLGVKLGNGVVGLSTIRVLKFLLDSSLGRMGNSFCGLILKK